MEILIEIDEFFFRGIILGTQSSECLIHGNPGLATLNKKRRPSGMNSNI